MVLLHFTYFSPSKHRKNKWRGQLGGRSLGRTGLRTEGMGSAKSEVRNLRVRRVRKVSHHCCITFSPSSSVVLECLSRHRRTRPNVGRLSLESSSLSRARGIATIIRMQIPLTAMHEWTTTMRHVTCRLSSRSGESKPVETPRSVRCVLIWDSLRPDMEHFSNCKKSVKIISTCPSN